MALARAFSTRPRVLFADEPTGNLDARTGATIIDLMAELNRDLGTTLVLVTHDLDLAGRARRTIRLADGADRRRQRGVRPSASSLFVLRMAAREIRAAPRRLLLLTASVAIGVAALVAIDSFTDNLRDSVRSQARGPARRRPRLVLAPASVHAGGGGGARLARRAGRRRSPG